MPDKKNEDQTPQKIIDENQKNLIRLPSIEKVSWDISEASLIWDEYKYRHDLIWKHLIRSTIAVIGLITVPYSKTLIPDNSFIVGASILAIGYMIFNTLVLHHEIELFEKIKERHRRRQNFYFRSHEKSKHIPSWSSILFYTYLIFLTLLVFIVSVNNLLHV